MKRKVIDVKKLLGLILLIGAVGALTIPAIPSVMAMNTPNVTPMPGLVVKDSSNDIKITADAGTLNNKGTVRVYDPDVTSTGTPTVDGGDATIIHCGDPTGGMAWELRHSPATATTFTYEFDAAGEAVTIKYGTGAPFMVTTTGTPTISSATVVWVEVPVAGAADSYSIITNPTDIFDLYRIISCGIEFFDDGDGGNDAGYEAKSGVNVIEAIAGTLLPINTTSLIIGGILQSPIFVLPILAGVAATAFTVLRLQALRK